MYYIGVFIKNLVKKEMPLQKRFHSILNGFDLDIMHNISFPSNCSWLSNNDDL